MKMRWTNLSLRASDSLTLSLGSIVFETLTKKNLPCQAIVKSSRTKWLLMIDSESQPHNTSLIASCLLKVCSSMHSSTVWFSFLLWHQSVSSKSSFHPRSVFGSLATTVMAGAGIPPVFLFVLTTITCKQICHCSGVWYEPFICGIYIGVVRFPDSLH